MIFRKREPFLVLLFSMLSCGIYYLYWIYQITKELGEYLQNGNNPGLELLLCILCFPYGIYWLYKMGKQIEEAQYKSGKVNTTDNSILYVVLSIFGFGIVAALIMQSSINEINA